MRNLFAFALAAALLTGCSHGRCYTDEDCRHGKVCMAVDEDGRVLAKPEKCPKGTVLCGLKCLEPCQADSCAQGQTCAEGGCCEAARACRLNSDCPGDQLCREGSCREAGMCHEKPAAAAED